MWIEISKVWKATAWRHRYFSKHWKRDVEFGGAELLDFFVGAGFLFAEVIGGKVVDRLPGCGCGGQTKPAEKKLFRGVPFLIGRLASPRRPQMVR